MKPKECIECGRTFVPRNGTQRYCDGPHTTVCKCCGRIFEYSCSPREKPKYCSQRCINEGKKSTVREKYGVDNVSKLDTVKRKISTANRSLEVAAKRKQTCMSRWGVDNVSKNDEVKKRMSTTMRTPEYLAGRAATCLEKYGDEIPMRTEGVKQRRAQTCIARYGTSGHPWTREVFEKVVSDPAKVNNYLSFKADPRTYIESHYSDKPFIFQLEADLGVTNTPIYDILVENSCQDMIYHSYSNMEDAVDAFLRSIDPSIKIIHNDRTVISPLEIDIYLPDYKIGIECNPAATHNSSIAGYLGSNPKHYKYHQNKSVAAAEAGVFLFHIYGYEWVNHSEIIMSMIRNLLGKTDRIVNGRGTYVCEVPYLECEKFLNANHRQGATASKIRLGLRIKETDELVSVMTFSKVRSTMGKSSNTEANDWELSRFCSLLNTRVRGAASKLFKAFLATTNPDKVISFSDVSHTTGKLYELLGFSKLHMTPPSYVWSDVYDNRYYHRVSCQKRYLRNLLKDDNIDIENQTERDIMESHGFVQVFDSGVIKWEYCYNKEVY